jgi:hypothetical protein
VRARNIHKAGKILGPYFIVFLMIYFSLSAEVSNYLFSFLSWVSYEKAKVIH